METANRPGEHWGSCAETYPDGTPCRNPATHGRHCGWHRFIQNEDGDPDLAEYIATVGQANHDLARDEQDNTPGVCLEFDAGVYFFSVRDVRWKPGPESTEEKPQLVREALPVQIGKPKDPTVILASHDLSDLVPTASQAIANGGLPFYCRTEDLSRKLAELLAQTALAGQPSTLHERIQPGPAPWPALPWEGPPLIKGASPSPSLPQGAHIITASAEHYHALREALAFNTFSDDKDGSPWPTAILQKDHAHGKAQLMPVGVEAQPLMPPDEIRAWAQRMWEQQKQLSDLDADALDILSTIWLRQARSPQDSALVDVDSLLTMRGIKPHKAGHGRRGGYMSDQRNAVLQTFARVLSLWLTMAEVEIYERGKKKPTKRAIQSRAFIVTDRVGQLRLDGFMDVDRFLFRPGEVFGAFLIGAGRQTALLSVKAVQYDPYRQTWEKRLTRYLSWQWRIRQAKGSYLDPYRVATLLEAVGQEPDRDRPNRTKERLEKCLETLENDRVIAGWQYVAWDESARDQRGWVDEWLQATVTIEPPDEVKEHYRTHLPAASAPEPPALPVVSLAERIARHRKARGLTQLQAAEELSITQGYMSRIERGSVTDAQLKSATRRKIHEWLGEDASQ